MVERSGRGLGGGCRSVFCAFTFPRRPGHSGGEIRDFHLLRALLGLSRVEFFALHHTQAVAQDDPLGARLEALHDPLSLQVARPDLFLHGRARRLRDQLTLLQSRWARLPLALRRYHLDAAQQLLHARAYSLAALRESLTLRPPDYFVVSPQLNPVALALGRRHAATRWVLASYDVEAERLRRFADGSRGWRRVALRLEARRARRFERRNLRRFDGVIAVSALDQARFVSDYALPPERVLAVDNGVDVDYFEFTTRRHSPAPQLVYVGSLAYAPNRAAALRLLRGIMPRIWARHPDAVLTIVGQQPGPELVACDDGRRVRVTGRIADVRPYLARADVLCVPLSVGSGTKLKVLEALAAGTPVVCTPVAAEGLDVVNDEHLLVRASDEDLAHAALQVIDDPALARRLAQSGRARVEARYVWDATLARLGDWLAALRDAPPRGA